MKDLSELIDDFTEQNQINRFEGEKGTQNLCRVVRAIGYKDSMHYGQFASDGAYGDLFEFFNDNPGAIEAVAQWIGEQDLPDWRKNIQSLLIEEEEDE